MDTIELHGVRTSIRVIPVEGGRQWTWEFHCENGLSQRNSEEYCPSQGSAWEEARAEAANALSRQK